MYGKRNGKRLKKIEFNEIFNILQTDWNRVELTGEQIPQFLKPLIKQKNCKVYASGYRGPDYKNFDKENGYPIAAGYRILRDAEGSPSGIKWKADDYTVLRDSVSGVKFLVAGSYKHPIEHHLKELPTEYNNLEIFEFNYPNCPKCGNQLDTVLHSCEKCGWHFSK